MHEAREALSVHLLRTTLSVLGVVLGVAAIVAVTSVAAGAERQALADVERLGLDNLVARSEGSSAYPVQWHGLTVADARALERVVPAVTRHAAVVERQLPIAAGGQRQVASVLGVEASFAEIVRLQLGAGRFLSAVEGDRGTRTCVLGADLARALFGTRRAVGEWVRVGPDAFLVIGVLARQGTTQRGGGLAWHAVDQSVFVPLPTLTGHGIAAVPTQPADEIWLGLDSGARVEQAGLVLRRALDARGVSQASVIVPRELLAERTRTQRLFAALVGGVAGLVLLVSGVGIMNVLLMSVSERAHEIGVRRTVGATTVSVARQFIVEATVMTIGGGLAGLLTGVVVARGITSLAGWDTYVSWRAALLALAVSALTGLLAGVEPARRAAALQPVDALRRE